VPECFPFSMTLAFQTIADLSDFLFAAANILIGLTGFCWAVTYW
jgi:hypothetical protein